MLIGYVIRVLLIVTLLNGLLASEIALLTLYFISENINKCYLQISCRQTQGSGLLMYMWLRLNT